MIEKSRLEELIEQGATIYDKYRSYSLKNEKYISSDFSYERTAEIKDNKLHYTYEDNDYYEDLDKWLELEQLFETEKDAKWYKEFGSIERTETLKLPTWEEFNKDNFGIKFYNKDREFRLHRVRYSSSDKNPLWRIDLYASYGDDEDTIAWKKSWDLTKENYIESCKLCVKLFKGE